ncbi:DUF3849 domain-containing protein [Ruminococcus sp. zg-924]|nr:MULTISPECIES: DUF3849 domain-containing protein [unclassified Ruminococcus]MCQ4022413.1 DUF3849 domain-containing protein [Ruminococcus sp. zg-924]MCQ4114741.1 DUF3849 domain-containing protein [Ruminococcus sp. zg-921]
MWSLDYAVRSNERDLWQESYRENCDCARAIERAINENYHDNRLDDCTKLIIDRYGFDRVNWVLANTIQEKRDDGRFSQENKAWAKGFYIPKDDVRWHFCVEAHPGLTDIFTNQVRRAWRALGLFDASHCESEKDGQLDYEGKVLVLRGDVLKDRYKTPEDQLFLADGGFGCRPNSRGRKVFGKFLKDGEDTHFYREDFAGILKDEYLPDWAREKLNELQPPEESEDPGMMM